MAENLQSQVTQSIALLSKTLRDDRKKCLGDGASLSQNLTAQISSLDRAKRQYEKAFREAEKAVDSFQKADADLNLSRADVSTFLVEVKEQPLISSLRLRTGGEAQADDDDKVSAVGRCQERVRQSAAEDESLATITLRVSAAGSGEPISGDRREADKGFEGVYQGDGRCGGVCGTHRGPLPRGNRQGVRVDQ